jgi:hypothetical protein
VAVRTEIAVVAVTGQAYTALLWRFHQLAATLILGSLALTVAVVPQLRRVMIRRAWCVLSRHRIQKVCLRPGCTPGPGGSPWSCVFTPPRSGNAH